MSVLKEIAAAVAGVYALLLVCDAAFGVGEARFDDDYCLASFYAPRPTYEFRFSLTRKRGALSAAFASADVPRAIIAISSASEGGKPL